ncbi:UDP-N-acetylmuramate--L-alanine ligase [Candidatus Uhrbacteria bacterium]|nr:UDP-N-acetylmuramate--L-alanine ligase [Candidatus Uhrbacteria bacterium]
MTNTSQRIHMIGIKGAGMSALALMLKRRGAIVSGSDVSDTFFTDSLLAKEGIPVHAFGEVDIQNVSRVIYSTAWEGSDEVKCAGESGVKVQSYGEAVAQLFNVMNGIAVAGSHGKTTISALCAHVFYGLGLDPSALVGSEIVQFNSNALTGASDYFILEADEYRDTFLMYHARAAVVSSIDYDHPDYFKTRTDYDTSFAKFVNGTSGSCIVCKDDNGVQRIWSAISSCNLVTYGSDASYDYALSEIDECKSEAKVLKKGIPVGRMRIQLIGRHNLMNALAVYALCDTLGVGTWDDISRLLFEFQGTARRFQTKGTCGHTLVIDDYAHHPTEIRATLHGARMRYPNKIIDCIFAPHTFSRTQELLDDFAQSFSDADHVYITDIFGSAREQTGSVSAEQLVAKIQAFSPKKDHVRYLGSNEQALDYLMTHLKNTDILVTMGAGDVYTIGEDLIRQQK